MIRWAFLVCLSTWFAFVVLASAAEARIHTPSMKQLADSADLIVIGKAESVRLTSPALWRRIGVVGILIASTAGAAALLRKRKTAPAACLIAVAVLLAMFAFDLPFDTYRRVADISVSSTIKGSPPAGNISVYYDDGFICDVTHLDAQQQYLLFLKKLPLGYAVSWCDWSVWDVSGGYAQTERRTWADAAPIAVAEFVSRIKTCRAEEGNPQEPDQGGHQRGQQSP